MEIDDDDHEDLGKEIPEWTSEHEDITRPWLTFPTASALIGAAMFMTAIVWLSACHRVPDGTDTPAPALSASGDTSPAVPATTYHLTLAGTNGLSVLEDPDTGCRYLVLRWTYEADITPRMAWDAKAKNLVHQGCRHIEVIPMTP